MIWRQHTHSAHTHSHTWQKLSVQNYLFLFKMSKYAEVMPTYCRDQYRSSFVLHHKILYVWGDRAGGRRRTTHTRTHTRYQFIENNRLSFETNWPILYSLNFWIFARFSSVKYSIQRFSFSFEFSRLTQLFMMITMLLLFVRLNVIDYKDHRKLAIASKLLLQASDQEIERQHNVNPYTHRQKHKHTHTPNTPNFEC